MSQRHELARRGAALDEIAGILRAMQALAVMQTQRLRERQDPLAALLASVQGCTADFLAWHAAFNAAPPAEDWWIVVGSEQGFCGDYNDAMLAWLDAHPAAPPARRIVVGRRLARRLPATQQVAGALSADELDATLARLLAALGAAPLPAGLMLLAHDDNGLIPRAQRLLPLAATTPATPAPYPPQLNLAPAAFFAALATEHLHATLAAALHAALLGENRQRLAHMDHALRRLDEQREALNRTTNTRRQEEITAEIESLLLVVPPSAGM